MGNFMIGDFYPPYLGRIDKVFCGNELCWPRDNDTQLMDVTVYVADYNGGTVHQLYNRYNFTIDKTIAEGTPYNQGENFFTVNKSDSTVFDFTELLNKGYAFDYYHISTIDHGYTIFYGPEIKVPYNSFSIDTCIMQCYFYSRQRKNFILMDNPSDKNIIDERMVYALDLEFGSLELFNITGEYGCSLIKIDSDGTVWEKSGGTYKIKETDPIERIDGETYFTKANDVIVYMQPFVPGTQKIKINIYQDMRNEGNYTLAYTTSETLDNTTSPGTTHRKARCNITYNEDFVKITLNQSEGILVDLNTDSPAIDYLAEGSFVLNYMDFTNDDSIVYEMNYYVGPGQGSWTIILRDANDDRTLQTIGMSPDEIWDNYHNNNVRNQSFQYQGEDYIRITYSEEILVNEPTVTARITKYSAGYWVDDYDVSVINRNGLKIFTSKHVSYCYINTY